MYLITEEEKQATLNILYFIKKVFNKVEYVDSDVKNIKEILEQIFYEQYLNK